MVMSKNYTVSQFAKLGKQLQEIKDDIKTNKDFGFNLPMNQFTHVMSVLPSQMFGPRVARYIRHKLGLYTTLPREGAGNATDGYGGNYTIRTSFVNSSGKINLVQLRQWHNIKGYICAIIDTRGDTHQIHMLYIPKESMLEELKLLNFNLAHGYSYNTDADALLQSTEVRVSLSIDGEHFTRWKEQYKNDMLKEKLL
jgi:hypothetical protein